MNYEELVKSLRICAKWPDTEVKFPGDSACIGCKYHDAEKDVCLSWLPEKKNEKLLVEAADAIDGLLQKMQQLEWIPVTERLPEKPGEYLVCDKYDYGYGAYYNLQIVSFTKNLNKVDKYDFPGKEYKRPGWYNYDSEYGHYETGREIIAWMPLPEPPKEEQT